MYKYDRHKQGFNQICLIVAWFLLLIFRKSYFLFSYPVNKDTRKILNNKIKKKYEKIKKKESFMPISINIIYMKPFFRSIQMCSMMTSIRRYR